MGIARDMMDQFEAMLRPLRNRVANTVARAVVKGVNDALKLQELQLGVMEDETIDEVERFAQYGFYSVPLVGAEVVVVFPNGDRTHPLCIATEDRRHRPKSNDPGEVGIYHFEGDLIQLLAGGVVVHKSSDIRLGSILASDPVALKSDLDALASHIDGHRHDAPQAPSGSLPTSTPTTTAAGARLGAADDAPDAVGAAKVTAE